MFKNKSYFIVILIALLAVVFGVLSYFTKGASDKMVSNITGAVQNGASELFSPITKLFDGKSSAELQKENEELKLLVNELMAENRTAQEYIKENDRLRGLLHLKSEITDKKVVEAKLIALDWDNISNTVTINRGSKDGIEIGDVVISTLGVVGRVEKVDSYTSVVTTILSPKHSIGARIVRTGSLAVAEGEATLSKNNKLRLDYITGNAEIIIGDIVESSGVGGVYPEGITIGKVSEIKKDNSGALSYAVLEPTADFSNLYEVIVITEWTREITVTDTMDETNNTAESLDEITDDEIMGAEG